MRTVRCLLPAAAAWLLCSMGTVLADEGVARTSDLRPAVGVASTTALRAARQDSSVPAATQVAPAASPAPVADKAPSAVKAPVVGAEADCCEEGCGEGCCGEEGCVGTTGKSTGLLSRLFGGKGSASKGHGSGLLSGAGNGRHAVSGKGSSHAHTHAGSGHAAGLAGGAGGPGAGAGPGGAAGGPHATHGSAAGGLHGLNGQLGNGHVDNGHIGNGHIGNGHIGNGHAGNGHGSHPGGQHGSIYNPASPGRWFGGHGAAACPNCRCNPCRCHGGYGSEFVDHGDRVFNCLFGWALPSGACGQGLPLVGKYNMVYADQPGYTNPADTQLYSAQGYGMPMTVPLAPTVNYQYNYSSGIPASRITTIGTWNPITSPQALPHQSW